jgi:hypothetical protein
MIYTIYNLATGDISGVVMSDDDHLHLNVPDGCSPILGEYDYRAGYIVDGQFIEYFEEQAALKAQRPPYRASWSNSAMSWIDKRNMEQARADQWEAIKAARTAAIAAPITVDGNTYDADQDSQTKIAGAVQIATISGSAFEIDWTLENNSVVTLSGPQIIAVGLALAHRSSLIYGQARLLRAQIDAATTTEEVKSITWGSE